MLKVVTSSGSAYEFEGGRVCRLRSDSGAELRRDGEWLSLEEGTSPQVGLPLVMKLEPLGSTPQTWRRTTPVVSIEGDDGTGALEMSVDDLANVHASLGDLPPMAAVIIHDLPGETLLLTEGT